VWVAKEGRGRGEVGDVKKFAVPVTDISACCHCPRKARGVDVIPPGTPRGQLPGTHLRQSLRDQSPQDAKSHARYGALPAILQNFCPGTLLLSIRVSPTAVSSTRLSSVDAPPVSRLRYRSPSPAHLMCIGASSNAYLGREVFGTRVDRAGFDRLFPSVWSRQATRAGLVPDIFYT